MDDINEIERNIVTAVYLYDLQTLHALIIKYIDFYDHQLANANSVNISLFSAIFEAYQNHDFLRLADIIKFGLN